MKTEQATTIRVANTRLIALLAIQEILFVALLVGLGFSVSDHPAAALLLMLLVIYFVSMFMLVKAVLEVRLDAVGITQNWLLARRRLCWNEICRVRKHAMHWVLTGSKVSDFVVIPAPWLIRNRDEFVGPKGLLTRLDEKRERQRSRP